MLAGFMIAIGAIVYLTVGGIAGALMFSVGLMSILIFKFNLFTGKAGLISTGDISILQLIKVWFANLIGVFAVGGMISLTPLADRLTEASAQIAQIRLSNGVVGNIILGLLCGVLMYIAVSAYKTGVNIFFVALPVATFILCGFNHCVADMFYLLMGATTFEEFSTILPTTVGNFIGCNFIPFSQKCRKLLL